MYATSSAPVEVDGGYGSTSERNPEVGKDPLHRGVASNRDSLLTFTSERNEPGSQKCCFFADLGPGQRHPFAISTWVPKCLAFGVSSRRCTNIAVKESWPLVGSSLAL